MEIIQSHQGDHLEVSIGGELDASSAIEMDDVILEAIDHGSYKILFDCSNLEYISSAGLGVFVSHIEEIKAKNGNLVFFNLSDKVENVFQILGLDQLVSIVKTKEEATAIIK